MPVTTRMSIGSQSWRPARTSRALKDTLEERVNAFFSQETHVTLHESAYRDWTQHTTARKSQWDLRTLLEVIKRIPLTTVKFVSNSAAYRDRIHFLYPFKPEMEHSTPKTPPHSPDTSQVSATATQSEHSPDLLTPTSTATTAPNTEPATDPSPQKESENIAEDITQTLPETFTPLQTIDTTVLTPESGTQDTEKGVTGRFIHNKVRDTFHQEFQQQFKQSFESCMNDYSDTLDTRIRHVVAEAMDDLYNNKVIPHVKNSVQEMYETVNNATIESLIDDKIGDQIHTSMEQSSIAILDSKATSLSTTVLNDIVRPEVNQIIKSANDEFTLNVLAKMTSFKNVVNTAQDEIAKTNQKNVQEIKLQSRSVTQAISTFKTNYTDFVSKKQEDLKTASEKILMDMSTDANTHLEYIAQESADAIRNLADIASDRTVNLKRSIAEDLQQAKNNLAENCQRHLLDMRNWIDSNVKGISSIKQQTTSLPEYTEGVTVLYTKDDSSVPVPVTIAAVHKDDDGEFFYTVRFPTGLEKQTISQRLKIDKSIDPKSNVNRFQKVNMTEEQFKVPLKSFYHKQNMKRSSPNVHTRAHQTQQQPHQPATPTIAPVTQSLTATPVYVDVDEEDDDEIEVQPNPVHSPARPTNQQYLPETQIPQTGPTPYMVTQFHRHFKGKIENKDMILTFYQQLHAQGRAYGIYVIDIKEIRQDCDLCPEEVSPVARNAMQIALFQKLQDVDFVSYDFKEAQNQIDAYSNTSDGYATLYQLLRMVHPHLMEGSKLYNAPKLSEAKNLSQYAAMCRNYILFQEIQNRKYTEKEKSEMFLQNVDDPEYSAGRAQCITELAVATLDGTSNVRISSMKFSNLPMTLQQYTNKLNLSDTQPVVRAMQKSQSQYKNKNSNVFNRMQRNSTYEPFVCIGCGIWGHKVTKCKTVPKVAIALEYIKNKPKHVQKLVSEFKRVNDKSTKRTTVRVLQSNGILESYSDPDTYLFENDIDVPMEETPQVDEE